MFDFSQFLSVYTAVLSAFFTMEGIGYLVNKRRFKAQQRNQQEMSNELEKAVEEGRFPTEINTLDFLEQNGMIAPREGPLTCSGENPPRLEKRPGQYL